MKRPRLLDLYCGAGGAAVGYHRAGFDVVGVDIRPQPRYPFEFHQADALMLMDDLLDGWPTSGFAAGYTLGEFAAIHASPPCQRYSRSTAALRNAGKEYPDLIGPTRERLQRSGLPWVMENVPDAPLRADFELCGCMFDLPGLRRERWFETNWSGVQMRPPCHHPDPIVTVIGHGPNQHSPYRYVPGAEWTRLKHAAMGIGWMNREELGEAIPPAYTRFIGEQLLAAIGAEVTS